MRSAATNRNVMYLFVRNVAKDDSETQCRFLSVLSQSVLNINVSAIQTPLKIKLRDVHGCAFGAVGDDGCFERWCHEC